MGDPFNNLNELSIHSDTIQEKHRASANSHQKNNYTLPRHKRGEKFLKGPIPWIWITEAGHIPGKALHVAMYIWHIAGMNDIRTVSINLSKFSTDWGFDRSTASKALKALETAHLVKVVRLPGQKSQVTLLDVCGGDDGKNTN